MNFKIMLLVYSLIFDDTVLANVLDSLIFKKKMQSGHTLGFDEYMPLFKKCVLNFVYSIP